MRDKIIKILCKTGLPELWARPIADEILELLQDDGWVKIRSAEESNMEAIKDLITP